jgi:hypothetical protein
VQQQLARNPAPTATQAVRAGVSLSLPLNIGQKRAPSQRLQLYAHGAGSQVCEKRHTPAQCLSITWLPALIGGMLSAAAHEPKLCKPPIEVLAIPYGGHKLARLFP